MAIVFRFIFLIILAPFFICCGETRLQKLEKEFETLQKIKSVKEKELQELYKNLREDLKQEEEGNEMLTILENPYYRTDKQKNDFLRLAIYLGYANLPPIKGSDNILHTQIINIRDKISNTYKKLEKELEIKFSPLDNRVRISGKPISGLLPKDTKELTHFLPYIIDLYINDPRASLSSTVQNLYDEAKDLEKEFEKKYRELGKNIGIQQQSSKRLKIGDLILDFPNASEAYTAIGAGTHFRISHPVFRLQNKNILELTKKILKKEEDLEKVNFSLSHRKILINTKKKENNAQEKE